MKRSKIPSWRWFSELEAIGWTVSAYLAALREMHASSARGEGPDGEAFADRFMAEWHARAYIAAARRGLFLDVATTWDIPRLAMLADPSFFAPHLNDLPGPENTLDNAEIQGVPGG